MCMERRSRKSRSVLRAWLQENEFERFKMRYNELKDLPCKVCKTGSKRRDSTCLQARQSERKHSGSSIRNTVHRILTDHWQFHCAGLIEGWNARELASEALKGLAGGQL